MPNKKSTWMQFELLVKKILSANNFKIKRNSIRGDEGFDFSGMYEDELWAIEVKYYRSARARASLINSAANRVVKNGINEGMDKGMLVVSSILPRTYKMMVENQYSIVVVDRSNLRNLAAVNPYLLEELDLILELESESESESESYPEHISFDYEVKLENTSRGLSVSRVDPPDYKGTELCKKLKGTPKGIKGWPSYEKVCIEILKYLFPNDLEGWHEQLSTDDGLNRYDYVCRIKPVTEFWKFLIDHLNSRYVVFEFKNYRDKITQSQVITTEKYLLENGLRKVAIIFSRSGGNGNAQKMIQGAMRESGKLMLVLNDSLLCEMLHMKERGEEPTDRLFQITDNFLLRLPR
ncbi:restriction endonuclease [Saccharospirillum sp. HFRX-1]|uniref:restriction endonuclease n=1 Tax=unclassified Saccharospirillum TaxID=2633430 RepID=UPI00371170AB